MIVILPGGALGWKTKGSLDPQFEEVAFALEPSTTANPKFGEAKSSFGYHIIMVSCRMQCLIYTRLLQSCRLRDVNEEYDIIAIYTITYAVLKRK